MELKQMEDAYLVEGGILHHDTKIVIAQHPTYNRLSLITIHTISL